ncbi:4Fe-4S binding protein [Chloroflexota bacterium]
MAIIVAERECFGCALCVLSCPEDAMKITSSFIVEINKDKCSECRVCLDFCPVEALTEA